MLVFCRVGLLSSLGGGSETARMGGGGVGSESAVH